MNLFSAIAVVVLPSVEEYALTFNKRNVRHSKAAVFIVGVSGLKWLMNYGVKLAYPTAAL
jgi:hypothetical protein